MWCLIHADNQQSARKRVGSTTNSCKRKYWTASGTTQIQITRRDATVTLLDACSEAAGLQQICKHSALSLIAFSYTRLCIMQSRLRALIGPETAAICDLVPPVRTTPCHQYSDQGVRYICKKVNLTTNITPSARLTIHFYGETLLCIILD
jgi:hypothetical protein